MIGEEPGHRFILQCEVLDADTIALELHGIDGTLHYSAQAVKAADELNGMHPPLLSLVPGGDRPVYGDVLFHGPEFKEYGRLRGLAKKELADSWPVWVRFHGPMSPGPMMC